mgnify:CR=1 FL=1
MNLTLSPDKKDDSFTDSPRLCLRNIETPKSKKIKYNKKIKRIKLFGHYFFFPKPHKFDLWHFDLFEKAGNLYMVASEEDADVVMLAVSEDWENFRMIRKPLINSFCMQNIVDYRQKYYKSTAIVEDENIRLFYTANPQEQYFK